MTVPPLTSPAQLPGDPSRGVLVLNAHPDDETLSSGPLIAWLGERGVAVSLVTATRGERGEIVTGHADAVAASGGLRAHRQHELDLACAALGIRRRFVLGTPPARAAGLPPRAYSDSGMRWLRPGLAGPAADVTADALTAGDEDEQVADLLALIELLRPGLLVGDDEAGGYGHPDHRRCHRLLRAASAHSGVAAAAVGPAPGSAVAGTSDTSGHSGSVLVTPDDDGAIRAALRAHASQLTLDGNEVVHSGGQREPITTTAALRPL
ncbi:MAG: PIG-L family deacetylase [Mycetocola reblochoni]|uniref:N-acetyl-1-D-myo-inosityl-2-amino-2-deoxy-alpha-D-glucopyranoside deacetylase MshB n=2 Tax=Mycetocola reblochoni TaxID=331618 RepID=A0A1R4III4_9MICO|nr:PIG-L family deacetylase [Mycetocola reblochoni]RLP69664.1 GlcNAc-PI de-N-acetylase [Mycetocola reblochoni]SJN19601.1 N-acetyl-1-D-myo-inosityl-2-amino-2-deoxy-alpha-D-glucopyranoside deacetylase MshB [Mycetocola reblochoni REB411]